MVIRMHGAVGNEQKAVEPPKPPKEDVRDNF
jgi:hypothetical protein